MPIFIFILYVGFIIRLFLIGNTGFLADVAFWKSWSLAVVDKGIVWTAHNTNINYPPGFIYVLWFMGKIYQLLGGDLHNYDVFWRENNYAFLFASKIIAILADTVIAILIYWFFSKKELLKKLGADIFEKTRGSVFFSNLPLYLAAIFYLNPIVIIDSALWGQVESFGVFFTVAAILLLFLKKPVLASIFFAVGTQMKLQNIIYIPIFFVFVARYYDFRTMFKSLTAFIGAFFLVVSPFILQNDMKQVYYLLTVNSDYFPWLSLNAHNLWWIVAGAKGMQITDKITVLGLMNAKTTGLIMFSSIYFLCCLLVFLKPTARNFLLSLTVGIFGFFLFTTQSHERYSYPVVVFLLFLYPFLNLKRKTVSAVSDNPPPVLTDNSHPEPALPAGRLVSGSHKKNKLTLNNLKNKIIDFFTLDDKKGFANTLTIQRVTQERDPDSRRSSTIGERARDGNLERLASLKLGRSGQDPKYDNAKPMKVLIKSSFLTLHDYYFWIVYILLTIVIFFNIHWGLIANYPNNGIFALARISTLPATILNSYLMIFLFFLLIPYFFSQIHPLLLASPLFLFLSGAVLKNSSYILKGKVYLSSYTPIIANQGYAFIQNNMSTSSFNGWKSWSRLSNNYFYYRKGVGTHANSTLVYDLNKLYSRFSSDYGVDTQAGTPATVTFEIYGDDRKLFASEKMGRFDFPKHVEVDIKGVDKLKLVVTDAGDGINSDHADWLNAILYK